MTQVTDRSQTLSAERGRSTALASAFVRGMVAAGLGFGSLAVLVVVLWISSPYPDSGPEAALRIAAGLWLLAHGAELVRPDTLGGASAPVGLAPLLLTLLPVWLAHRAARDALVPDEGRAPPSSGGALWAVTIGYLLVAGAVTVYAMGGAMPVDPVSLVFPPLLVAGATAAGVWTASGRPLGPLPSRAPRALRAAVRRPSFRIRTDVVLRSAVAGVMTLLGGGALLVAVELVSHGGPAQESFLRLSGEWSGRFAVMLLGLVLVPNAAMWGAAYGLGSGFALGTESTVSPFVIDGKPALPDFPLLAAVPTRGPVAAGMAGTVAHWAVLGVPVVAAVTIAWFTVRRAAPVFAVREEAWSAGDTARTAALGATGCAVGTAMLTAMAGGPLGTGKLAEFGPVWWLTGLAAWGWTVALAVPGALLLRAWRLRERNGWGRWRGGGPPADVGTDDEAETRGGAGGSAPDVVAADGTEEEEARTGRWRRGGRRRRGGGRGESETECVSLSELLPPLDPADDEEEDADLGPYDFLPTDPWPGRKPDPDPESGPGSGPWSESGPHSGPEPRSESGSWEGAGARTGDAPGDVRRNVHENGGRYAAEPREAARPEVSESPRPPGDATS
ncbi:DUF6350 family protein [Streptomyces sp. DT24]|uniref:cell division protein PerM n=1 Tax=Streptomyces sp. DT24 TaxID=3416520 RepID=UPI003CE6A327